MYEPDSRDTVVELADMPAPDAGAPLPLVVADDDNVILAFIISVDDPPTDEPPPGELFAVVRFRRRSAHFFGAPNDETLAGHPLYERGLRHYACAEVRSSSWIRQLERVNAVHPRHNPARYAQLRHFIFAFHDSTFECAAAGYEVSQVRGSVGSVLVHMARMVDPSAA